MAESLVKNKLGNVVKSFRLPCDDTVASTFADSFLDGEYAIYSKVGVAGSDTATSYNDVSVMVKSSTGLKTYLNLAVKSTKSEDEIFSALKGKTFNGVLADEVAIIKMRAVSLA
jgi:hypothetical protein